MKRLWVSVMCGMLYPMVWRRCCDYGGLLGNEGSLETRSWKCAAEGRKSSLCYEDVEIDGWRGLEGEEKDG